ncbi:MAG: glycosyltransferase, partial [Syntrophorhabdaceae bacterium]|nr:glycosyltransferase [Syntrophorhabdaceae bacterium]
MYLRIYEHYKGKYEDAIIKVIKSHLCQLKTMDLISNEDQRLINNLLQKKDTKIFDLKSRERKKVTFVAQGPNHINGPNIWLQRILPELARRGFDAEVIFLMFNERECNVLKNLRENGIKCTRIKRRVYTEENIVELLKVIKANPPDVFVPNLCVPAYYASKWIKASGIPTVGILHSDDTFHHELIDFFVSGEADFRLSGIVAVSKFIEALVTAKKGGDVELLYAPYGINVPPEMATKPENRLNIVYVGRLIQRQKKIFDLLESLERVVKEIPGTYATLYGEDREGGRVIEKIKKMNLGERLKWGGLLNFEEILPELTKHHVFVLLSDYEGLPISLLEAMGCGLVPVCLKIRSGVTEIIKDNQNGLLVDNRHESFIDAIKRLKNEKGLWDRLSKAARETIEKEYSIDVCADKWADFLNELIEKSKLRSPICIPDIEEITLPPLKMTEDGICREDVRMPRKIEVNRNFQTVSHDFFIEPALSSTNMDLYFVRSAIFNRLKEFVEQCKGVILDIGCGEMPYREFILQNRDITGYIGMDIENPKYQINKKPDLFWDGKRIPLNDNSIDCAIATELFEHVPNIEVVLKEAYRVLKPGGKLFFTVPFLWPIHDNPYDEYRYTPFSLHRHLKNAGFTDINIEATGGWDASLAQMIGLWVRRSPMGEEERAKFTELLYPFYIELLKREEKKKRLTYDDMTENSIMITGLTGTCKKPLSQHAIDEYTLAIVCPQVGAVSETFIRRHIENIAPKKTVILTGSVIDNTWFDGPIKIIPIQLGFYKFDPKTEQEVIEFLKVHRVTHILCEFGCIGGAVVDLNARILKLPVFVHFHGQDASEFLRRPEIVSYYKWMGDVVDGVITVSEPMTQRLCEIGIPSYKVKKIHYGVDVPEKIASPEKEPCCFIAVTRLVAKKGIMYLLKAFQKAHSVNSTIQLHIIGDGPMKGDVERFIKENQLDDAVILYGSRPNEFVLKKLAESSVYVQHSITDPDTGNAEGLPNSILEASILGLPVIATRHEGIPEAVEHGVTGFLVDEADVDKMAEYMLLLARDKKLRKDMGLSARQKMLSEDFITEKMTKNLRDFMGIIIYDKTHSIDKQTKLKEILPKRVLFVNHSIFPYELSGTPLTTYNHA